MLRSAGMRAFCWVTTVLLGLGAAWPASALETNLEAIFLKITDIDEEVDPDTVDADENFIADRAHTRFLERVLADNTVPNHVLLLAIFTFNRIRLDQDNTLTFQCTILQNAYGVSCDELEVFGAGYFTIGEATAIPDIVEGLAEFGLTLDPDNYNLTGVTYLGAGGDLDGDGFTNLQEYDSVCGDIDQFVEAAVSTDITPENVPCCVNCPLIIVKQPDDASRYVGDAQVFTVEAEGLDGTVTYQWSRNGTPIEGANENRLNLGTVDLTDAGGYRCSITDAEETVRTRTATLTVSEHVSITQQPQNATKLVGQSHQFTTSALGGIGALSYQWRKGGNPFGGSAPMLSFGSLESGDAGSYDVIVSDANESQQSNLATLVVLPRIVIETAPLGARKYVGESHTFTTSTSGGLLQPPAFTWLRGSTVVSEGSSEYTIVSLATADAGNYVCRVSDGVDTLTSATAKLQVAENITLLRQPSSVAVNEGDSVTLRVEVFGGFSPLVYTWFHEDAPLDLNRPRITLDAVTEADAGEYYVVVTDGAQTVLSEVATVVVNVILPEGEGEGAPEGTTEGNVEGTSEGVVEGSTEGSPEGTVEGTPEGSIEGTSEGTTEGSEEGVVEGTIEGNPEGQPEGSTEGVPEGTEEGSAEGSLEGSPEGSTEGTQEGLPEGTPEGLEEGEGQSEGSPEGVTEGVEEGQAEGTLEGEGAVEGEGGLEGEGEFTLTTAVFSTRDATLYEDENGALANGSGQHFFVGRNGSNEERRALLLFDVAATLPSNALIVETSLRLNLSRTNASQSVSLHRVLSAWGEGASDASGEEGGGAPSQPGDATWVHTQFDGSFWENEGGDFEADALLTQFLPGLGEQEFFGDEIDALVQTWVDQPASNHGLLIKSETLGAGTSQRFDSHENPSIVNRPVLLITYVLTDEEGEGTLEGSLEGEGEGAPEGVLEGEGAMDGEGSMEGAVDGEGSAEGEGQTEGMAEGEGEGTADGEGEGEGEVLDVDAAAEQLLEMFRDIDEDDNGRIAFEVAQTAIPGLTFDMFDELDVDGSGELSVRELRSFLGIPQGRMTVLGNATEVGLNYDIVAAGLEKDLSVRVQNSGSGPLDLTLSILTEDEGLSVVGASELTLAGGVIETITVRFAPPAGGEYEGQLKIDPRDGTDPALVPIVGEGLGIAPGGCAGEDGEYNLQLLLTFAIGLLVLIIAINRLNSEPQ